MNIQVKTDIKLDDCDEHVRTDCENDHSTSKVLGRDQAFNKPYFDLWTLTTEHDEVPFSDFSNAV